MTYFFDNNFSIRMANALRCLFEDDIVHLRGEFHESTDDVEWLPAVAQRGWIIFTADTKIKRVKYEWAALMQYQGCAIFFNKSIHNLSLEEKTIWFIRHWGTLTSIRFSPGDCWSMTMKGTLEPVLSAFNKA